MAISKKGRIVDMDAMVANNQHVKAVGNANMNARGDIVDAAGNVIETREEQTRKFLAQQAYNQTSSTVKPAGKLMPDNVKVMTPQEAVAKQYRGDMAQRREEKQVDDTPVSTKGRKFSDKG